MLWHIAKIQWKADLSDDMQRQLETELADMGRRLPTIAFFRVTRCIDDDRATVVLSGFEDEVAFENYLQDPQHEAIAVRVREHRVGERLRIDAWTDDPPEALKRSL